MLREKEINTCGGEAGWLFNYKVLPRSKSGQLQMFQTWLENRIPGGGGGKLTGASLSPMGEETAM